MVGGTAVTSSARGKNVCDRVTIGFVQNNHVGVFYVGEFCDVVGWDHLRGSRVENTVMPRKDERHATQFAFKYSEIGGT